MKQAQLIRTAKGLYSQWNNIYGIPEGGLLECVNWEMARQGVLSKIRGRNRYGTVSASSISKMFEYRNRVFRYRGTTLDYDSDGAGAWTALTGSFSPPNASHRLRVAEDRESLYFSTSLAPYKKATLADAPVRSGIHEALDIFLTKTGTGAGIFPTSAQVAYRITWGREDANKKKLEGAPSWREILTNSVTAALVFANAAGTITVTHAAHGYANGDIIEVTATSDVSQVATGVKTITVTGAGTYTFAATGAGGGGTISVSKRFNVSVNATIPTDIVAGDNYRVYRTDFSADDATAPGDEMKLVEEVAIVAGDIAAGTVTYTDSLDEAFLGDPLYSNANNEGSTNINSRPPFCIDLALWKGHMWYAGTREPHELQIQMLTVVGLVDGTSSITVSDGAVTRTYTFNATENVATQTVQRYTTGTGAANVANTMKSFCKVLNRDTGQTVWECRYISEEEDAPGKVELRRRTVVDTAHFLTCNNGTTSTKFTPNIPTAGQTLISKSNAKANGLANSKFEQPEAVTPSSTQPVGPENRAIVRIIPLRDSLVIVTEKGIYRVSGESDGATGQSFSISELDPSINGVAPDTWTILNNSAFGLATQGVIRADESGTDLISHQIEDDLKRLFGISNYAALSFAIAYESSRELRLSVPDAAGDTYPTVTRVYNYLTNTWANRDKPITAAHVLISDDKLYEAHAVDLFVLKERKTFATSGSDHRDEDLSITVTAVGTTINSAGNSVTQVAFNYTYTGLAFQTGFLFQQGDQIGIIDAFTLAGTLVTATLDAMLVAVVTGAATVSLPINSRARWRPEVCSNAAVNKQFSEVQLYLESNSALVHRVGFSSDVDSDETFVREIRLVPGYGWGEGPWGEFGWGDEGQAPSTPVRVQVPRDFQRCRALTLAWEHKRAGEKVDLAGVGYIFRAYSSNTVRSPA